MSALPRSLRLLHRHGFALALCLFACLFPSPAIAATTTVYVGDIYFSNNSGGGGGNTTTITAGDTIHWLWQGTMFHDSVSGVCSPGCVANGIWSSGASKTSGFFDRTFFTVGSFPYFCSVHGSGQVGTIVVNPGPASFLVLSGVPGSATAGTPFNVTVTAYDAFGNVATGYGGTVSFTSNDGQAILPSGTLFSGSRVFSINLRTAGSHSLTANGTGVSSSGTAFINVSPAATSQYIVAPSANPVNAGASFNVTVTATDPYGNTTPSYGGTVHFTSSDGTATLPANNTLVSGSRTFTGAILRTSGTQTVTATDTINGTITGFATLTVNPGPATHMGVTAPPSASVGLQFNITVTALDQFNNQASSYAGTVHFTSSDGGAVKPADSTLSGGASIFAVTLNTVGTQSVTATDTVTSSITGSANITVKPPCSAAPKIFSNSAAIPIPDVGLASSSISVSGFTGQTIGKVTVTLRNFSHTFVHDIGLLLVAPSGQKMVLMSDVGGGNPGVSGIDITFDDAAATIVPSNPFPSGAYKPTDNITDGADSFPGAPPGPYATPQPGGTATLASTFNGIVPNGTWTLYVYDDAFADIGQIAGGWSLTITPQQTFANPAMISFSTTGAGGTATTSPYPSLISVSGLPGNILKTTLTLNGFSASSCSADLAILLQGPRGQIMIPFSLIGPCFSPVNNVTLSLDDLAASPLPVYPGAPSSGTYRPASYLVTQPGFQLQPVFTAPAPAGPYTGAQLAANDGTATFANVFNGTDPNGTWSLYIRYQPQISGAPADNGQFAGGWSLAFQTDCPAGTNCSVGSNANPSVFGQPVTLTATVTSGSGTPNGNVTFKDSGSSIGGGTLSGGVSTLNTAALAIGSHPITVDYAGNTTFAVSTSAILNQVVNQAATTTVVTSPGASVFGQSVTFTATVTVNAPGAGTPTGTVTFKDGVSTLGSGPLGGGGTATFSTSSLSVGPHTMITAVYSGDGNFNGSTSAPYTQVVNPGATATGVGTSGSPSIFGNSVTFTATVTVTPPAVGTPTGTVTFKDGGSPLGTGPLNGAGIATFSTTSLSVSSHSITAVYAGDGNFASSTSSAITQNVNQGTTTTTVNSSGSPSVFGNPVAFTATVAVTTGAGTPTGTVTFNDGPSVLGTGALTGGGTATFTTSSPALPAGSHSITAVYSGDANFAGSTTSAPFTQIVNRGTTTTGVSTSGSPSMGGNPVTFTATVAVSSGQGMPTGTVTFKDGPSTTLGTGSLSGGGTATFMTSSLTAGSHSITAMYAGDANFSGSTSPPITQVVNAATTALVSSPNPSGFAQNVTLTATVTGTTITPTGTVAFMDGATNLGTKLLNGAGVATFTTKQWTIGTHSVTAVYSGDGTYAGSTSNAVLQRRSPEPVPRGPAR